MTIKKLTGTQPTIAERLEIPDIWTLPATQAINDVQIKLDIPRQLFLDNQRQHEEFSERWLRAASQENYAFTQGDMSGGGIAELIFTQHSNLSTENPKTRKGFNFGYINKDGELCGLTLAYFAEQPSMWVVSILQNAEKPHNQRKCTIYHHGFKKTGLPGEKTQLSDMRQTINSDEIATFADHFFRKHHVNEGFIDFCDRNTQQKNQVIKPARLTINDYCERRTEEYKEGRYSNSSLLNSLVLFKPPGRSARSKLMAAEKLSASMDRLDITYSDGEQAALKNGRLARLANETPTLKSKLC